MKKALIFVISLVLVFSLAACTSRDMDNSSSSSTTSLSSSSTSTSSSTSSSSMTSSSTSSSTTSSSSVAAMGTDFSQIGTLASKRLDWGSGGPVDDKNRSVGAVSYQDKYGQYDADFIRLDSEDIYLTFDEGYENGYTPAILDVLKEKNVRAVFFVTYPFAKQNPDLIRRMIAEGHIVGNHSVNHPYFSEISLEKAKTEIMDLHDYIKQEFDYEMNLFRFPSGCFNEQTLALVQSCGYRSVFWSFAYADYDVNNQPDPQTAYEKIVKAAAPGAIYLLHAVSDTNTQILGDVIDNLRAQGYTLASYDL